MKKTKFISLVLVVAIMLIGAGYAAWTDRIILNNTVETGRLDVHYITNPEGTEFEGNEYIEGKVTYSREADDPAGNNTLDVANVKISKMFPGAKATINLVMKNNSTMPVTLDWRENLRTLFGLEGNVSNAIQFAKYFTLDSFYIGYTDIDDNWVEVDSYNGILSVLADERKCMIKPNSEIYFTYTISANINRQYGQTHPQYANRVKNEIAEDSSYSFTIAPVFGQYNNNGLDVQEKATIEDLIRNIIG